MKLTKIEKSIGYYMKHSKDPFKCINPTFHHETENFVINVYIIQDNWNTVCLLETYSFDKKAGRIEESVKFYSIGLLQDMVLNSIRKILKK